MPISHRLRVRDELHARVHGLRAPLDLTMPIHTRVPLQETLRIEGSLRAPIRATARNQLKKDVTAHVAEATPLDVTLDDTLPVQVDAQVTGNARLRDRVPVRLDPIDVRAEDLQVQVR